MLSSVVIDNFYPYPDVVRAYALSLPFKEADSEKEWRYYKGQLTSPDHVFAETGRQLIQSALGSAINSGIANGEFRLLEEKKDKTQGKTWVHADSCVERYSAIVYLNTPEQCEGGTAFYRHKELGLDRMPVLGPEMSFVSAQLGTTSKNLLERLVEDGYSVEEKWEMVGLVGMRYNRCVIFDSAQFHARTGNFGTRPDEARLTQNFFFDIVAPLSPLWRTNSLPTFDSNIMFSV